MKTKIISLLTIFITTGIAPVFATTEEPQTITVSGKVLQSDNPVQYVDKSKQTSTANDTPKPTETPKTEKESDPEQIKKLQDEYESAKETEQSKANRLLTSASMAATGIGTMELMQGLSEQKADKAADADMNAYISTMRCSYGNGKSVKASADEIELPGGNDTNMMKYRAEYTALANDLKERKTALNMTPGIESEEILDKSTMGLYDDENVGITAGNYASRYRAQMLGSESDQTQLDEAAQTSKTRVIGGAVAAGAGAVGGIVGDELINGKSVKTRERDKIIKSAQECVQNGGKWLETDIFRDGVATGTCSYGSR